MGWGSKSPHFEGRGNIEFAMGLLGAILSIPVAPGFPSRRANWPEVSDLDRNLSEKRFLSKFLARRYSVPTPSRKRTVLMATDKQIAANRRNAQKSSGPRTEAARQASPLSGCH
jgi:hypothetical protein